MWLINKTKRNRHSIVEQRLHSFLRDMKCAITCLTWWRGWDLLVGVNGKFRGQSFKLILADHVELFKVLHILKM